MFRKLGRFFGRPRAADLGEFRELFGRFQQILKSNNRVLELISDLEDKLGGEYIFDINFLKDTADELSQEVYIVCSSLNVIADNKYHELFSRQAVIREQLNNILLGQPVLPGGGFVIDYSDIDSDMVELAGGKNANLGEIKNHLKMFTPDGFIISTTAYHRFMTGNGLWPEIRDLRKKHLGSDRDVAKYDQAVDRLFADSRVPLDIGDAISEHLESLRKRGPKNLRLAIRSSALGEDASGRSFAGQFESALNVRPDDVFSTYVKVPVQPV